MCLQMSNTALREVTRINVRNPKFRMNPELRLAKLLPFQYFSVKVIIYFYHLLLLKHCGIKNIYLLKDLIFLLLIR